MVNLAQLARADLNLLVLFQAVFEARHVGRAATTLRLTPSAVSHGLGRLRQLLDDPLFLRTPRGVVPTMRAQSLAAPIAELLSRTSALVAPPPRFDPAHSTRRFLIGAPDAVAAVLLPELLARLSREAPTVGLGVRQILPPPGAGGPAAWRAALDALDDRSLDLAVVPLAELPARFEHARLYDEDFVIAARRGHRFVRDATLERFCGLDHVVVSLLGDPHGFVDDLLAHAGHARRVAVTVPNFMLALAVVAESDMVAAVPRRLLRLHARRFGLVEIEPPLPLRSEPIAAVASRAALAEPAVAWLHALVQDVARAARLRGRGSSRRKAARQGS